MPAGAASSSTSSGSFSNRQELARINPAIRRLATGSASSQPVVRITIAATTTPTELSASAAE